jgi:hypothetical protein
LQSGGVNLKFIAKAQAPGLVSAGGITNGFVWNLRHGQVLKTHILRLFPLLSEVVARQAIISG